jgi:transposase, IS5 family
VLPAADVLKFRHRLGYESLCAEVADSISWRRFCRIPLDGKVPHPTTLMKLTTCCGEDAVAGPNETLWAKASGQKLLRTARVRGGHHGDLRERCLPGGLRAAGPGGRQAGPDGAAGAGRGRGYRTVMTDRRRAAARRVRQIASTLRSRGKLSREASSQMILRVTGESSRA